MALEFFVNDDKYTFEMKEYMRFNLLSGTGYIQDKCQNLSITSITSNETLATFLLETNFGIGEKQSELEI